MIGKNSVYDCPVIPLNKIHSRAGNITIAEVHTGIPFDIQRVYYLYDIPGGESRGGHAHKELYQIIVAVGGGFDILLDDGRNKKVVRLNRPDFGLMIVPGIWRELMDFTSGAVCMVMASLKYDEKDYIREYSDFQQLMK
ncbi:MULTISPECIES: sugar 3,4-ketoisomerase [Bacteria]|uniref:sugar 3,4-ketoisomerase n=1 Tax=Bacteria TaxID=2 RepID=UPI00363468EB